MRFAWMIPLLAAVTLPAAPVAHAAEPRGAFLLRTARDTVMIEQFERGANTLSGALVFKLAGARFDYTMALLPDATVRSMTNAYRDASAAPDSPAKQSATIEFVGDSAIATILPGGVQRLACQQGAIPFVNPSMVMVEQIVRRAIAIGGDHVSVPMFAVAGGRTLPVGVDRAGRDSVVLTLAGIEMRLAVDADGALRGGTIPAQGLTIERVDALPPGALLMPKPDYTAPADVPYTAEEVSVPTRGGFALAGTLTRPRGAKAPPPVVVMITGSGAEDRDESLPMVPHYRPFRQVADALGRRGIAVLRMDDRGFGASGGKFSGATSEDFAHDIEDAVKWLRARAGIDGSRIALAGHSEGGLVAPLVAVADPSLRGIVLLAGPAYDGRRIIDYQTAHMSEIGGKWTPAQRDSLHRASMQQVDSLAKSDPWMRYFMTYDPLPTARRVKVPVLILQGETDRQVTFEQAAELEKAFKAGGNRDVTRRVFPATNHLFVPDANGAPEKYSGLPDSNVRPEVLAAIGDWLAKRLK